MLNRRVGVYQARIYKIIMRLHLASLTKKNIYHLLHKLNLSWITTRSKYPKQSIEAQESCKKIQNKNDPLDPLTRSFERCLCVVSR